MKKESRISFRLDEDLRNQLESEAKQLDIDLSKLMRSKLTAKKISKPRLKINSNLILSFEQLASAKVVYEDVIL
jgi:hypothetical protein